MTEIKICGITRIEDALCAAESGADAIGFIFHPASPRYITPERAKEIIAELPAGIVTVGVFVNRPAEEVERTAEACGLDLIQLHGDESPAVLPPLPGRSGSSRPSPRGRPRSSGGSRTMRCGPSSWTPGMRAATEGRGSGPTGSSRPNSARTHPLILAGGLDAGNIARGDRRSRPARRGHQQRLRVGAGDQGSRPDAADHWDDSGYDPAVDIDGRAPGQKTIFDATIKSRHPGEGRGPVPL